MSEINITVPGGESIKLKTAGKYCDRDIVVTATGSAADPVIEPLEVTGNGTYTAPDGVDGYSPITVNVAGSGGDAIEIARSIINKTITSYSDDELTSIGHYAFYNCSKLTELNAPNVTAIGNYAFQGSKVTKIFFPELARVGINAFRNAKTIESIDLPICTALENASVHSCTALKTVNFPKVEHLVRACMTSCTALEYVDLPVCTTIEYQAFNKCTSLKTLVLRSATICTLENVNAFSSCSALENIYVNDTLLEDYKVATNWVDYADKFKPLSELEVTA